MLILEYRMEKQVYIGFEDIEALRQWILYLEPEIDRDKLYSCNEEQLKDYCIIKGYFD